MKLTFLGAAQEVTGSCFLIEAQGLRCLVDCGMHQGGAQIRQRNLEPWPFEPRDIDLVLLTHAHIDHSGLLPRLCALGFKGVIFATAATVQLLEVMLLDSAHIQEGEWTRQMRRHQRRQAPGGPESSNGERRAVPPLLYTVAQAQACLEQLQGVPYGRELRPHPQLRCRFLDAGHILGSAIIEVWVSDGERQRKIVFSGDLGQPGRPVVRDPTPVADADVLVVESTYGNRLHRPMQATVDELVEVVDDTLRRRQGNIIIPAFALGRTQELLHLLTELCRQGRLPRLQVFVDSPMAHKVTQITWQNPEYLDDTTRELMTLRQDHPEWLDLRFTPRVEDSVALNRIKAGAIIIAASGMCDAGRILHHLRHHLPRAENAIVIVGFQAEGTLGRRLVDGAKQVRIMGEDVQVRAGIHTIGGLSAHADQAALLGWLGGFAKPPLKTYVVHGEAATAIGFAALVQERLGWRARAPVTGETISL